jgi:hypothetical protein
MSTPMRRDMQVSYDMGRVARELMNGKKLYQ